MNKSREVAEESKMCCAQSRVERASELNEILNDVAAAHSIHSSNSQNHASGYDDKGVCEWCVCVHYTNHAQPQHSIRQAGRAADLHGTLHFRHRKSKF